MPHQQRKHRKLIHRKVILNPNIIPPYKNPSSPICRNFAEHGHCK